MLWLSLWYSSASFSQDIHNEGVLSQNFNLDLPAVKVGAKLYKVSLTYQAPRWIVSSATNIAQLDSTFLTGTFENNTLNLPCIRLDGNYYSAKLTIAIPGTYTFGLSSYSKLSSCAIPADVGPIPYSQFKAVEAPTLSEVMDAYEQIEATEPQLLNNNRELTKRLFEKIKALKESGTKISPLVVGADYEYKHKISREEWTYLIGGLYAASAIAAYRTVGPSFETAVTNYPCDSHPDDDLNFQDGKADAVRHAYWNALMTKRISYTFAEGLATAHENSLGDQRALMDLHNNKVGRDIAKSYPKATDAQLREILMAHKFVYAPTVPAVLAADPGALVYFRNQAEFDGTMKGTSTNPDAGVTWNTEYEMNQCNDTIRGSVIEYIGTSYEIRRFTGTLNSNGSITLNVSQPFDYEIPENWRACTGVKMELTGNSRRLSGPWTSSNCPAGGVVNIAR
jgi:hypothetical protein